MEQSGYLLIPEVLTEGTFRRNFLILWNMLLKRPIKWQIGHRATK